MYRTVFGLALAATVFVPFTATAQNQPVRPCGDRNTIVERLASKWGESFAGGGMQSASAVFEIWMSEEKGTWTILRTSADGTACVMASGTNWLEGLSAQQVAGIEG